MLLVIALATLLGCSKKLDPKFTTVPRKQTAEEIEAARNALDTIEATTFVATPKQWPVIIKSQGSLEADQISTVASEVDGRVIELVVDIGDKVKAGQVLAKIDPSDYELLVQQSAAKLVQAKSVVGLKENDSVDMLDPPNAPPTREARAVWDETKQQVKRIRTLYDQKAISDVDLDAAEAAERVAEARYASALNGVREKIAIIKLQTAELEIAKQQLSQTSIISPINGRVQSRAVAQGNFVSPGQALFTIAVTELLRYRSSVPEKYAQELNQGQSIKVMMVGGPQSQMSTIARIAPTLDLQTRSLYFEALIKNPEEKIRPGLFAESEIVLDPNNQAIVLPNSALIRFAGIDKVWKVVDGVAKEVVVRVGRRTDKFSEILEGVSADDVVIEEATKGRIAKVRPQAETKPVLKQTVEQPAPQDSGDPKQDTTGAAGPASTAAKS